jgi:5-methylcytosine-specific restriction protein A
VVNLWDKYKDIVTPINPTINKRKTRFIITCLTCSNKREVCYAQAWNIIKNNNSGNCQSCAEKNKPPRPKKEKQKRRKLSDFLKYRNMFENPAKDPVVKEKMRLAKLGKRNELANNWQGGKTKERILLCSREEYKELRKKVFARDCYKCVLCLNKNNLQMDHIKEWKNYPELRFEITNCRTLCVNCHKKTDNYGHKAIQKKRENT